MKTTSSPSWNLKIIAVCSVIAAVMLNGGLRVFNIWLSPTGRVLDSVVFAIWAVQISLFIVLILIFILGSSRGNNLSERWQTIYVATGIYLFAGVASIPVGNQIAGPIQQRGYEAFVLENDFLITAIEAFEAEIGRPPDSLEELVPNQLAPPLAEIAEDPVGDSFVSKIEMSYPYSSIDAKSAEDVLYSFEPAEGDDPWQLQVSIYLGSFQSTRFIYNPEENYSNRYSKVGRWGLAN